MYSDTDDLAVGFPHSEILGSKSVCRLPEAYRRLLRPSSPPIAKASTVCAYSLDHINPNDSRFISPASKLVHTQNNFLQYTQNYKSFECLYIADSPNF